MNKFYVILASTCLSLISCKEAKPNLKSNIIFESEDNWKDPNPALTNEINAVIQSKLISLRQPCNEENQDKNSECALVDISPSEVEPREKSLGYRIMVIDDPGMLVAAYTRYKDRVIKNIFEDENTGQFKANPLNIQMPKAAREILEQTFENPAYGKIPSELLTSNQNIFYNKFKEMAENINFKYDGKKHNGHSTVIFNYLANNNPNSEFILMHINENKFTNIFCNRIMSLKDKEKNINKLFKAQSNDIIEQVNKFKISFISYSRGYSNNTLTFIENVNKCENITSEFKSKINKSYFENFLKPITTNTNAILVQSNTTSDYLINSENDENYYSDCQSLKNRIRVGFANDLQYSIPIKGSNNIRILKGKDKNFKLCTDIYINFAVEKERPYRYRKGAIQFSSFNIGTIVPTGYEVSSSNATPVALSYLIYLKSILQKENPTTEISNEMLLNRLYENNNFIFDPSLHKQLPIYELGYLQ
ncbi:hypothetical protein [Fluviispira multicolorata]|uniref:Uncharacterized protein n=1 Tax=Fluviispira multicolorata TaxID=2654512 RepID=A0A833N3D7_9BACT|nr:hypothetical protein [Fluviispira multicolorata]KAB8029819.1 hypothetical protein GCL57_09780 [Fluviispira multicolorata]